MIFLLRQAAAAQTQGEAEKFLDSLSHVRKKAWPVVCVFISKRNMLNKPWNLPSFFSFSYQATGLLMQRRFQSYPQGSGDCSAVKYRPLLAESRSASIATQPTDHHQLKTTRQLMHPVMYMIEFQSSQSRERWTRVTKINSLEKISVECSPSKLSFLFITNPNSRERCNLKWAENAQNECMPSESVLELLKDLCK